MVVVMQQRPAEDLYNYIYNIVPVVSKGRFIVGFTDEIAKFPTLESIVLADRTGERIIRHHQPWKKPGSFLQMTTSKIRGSIWIRKRAPYEVINKTRGTT